MRVTTKDLFRFQTGSIKRLGETYMRIIQDPYGNTFAKKG